MIQLKHYLGTDLKVLVTDKGESKVGTMNAIYSDGSITCFDTIESVHTEYKPYLYSMDALFKEVINTDIGNPTYIDVLRELHPNCPNFYNGLLKPNHSWLFHKKNLSKTFVEYAVANRLFEWHFDFFGLIPQGKAIDKSTLKL